MDYPDPSNINHFLSLKTGQKFPLGLDVLEFSKISQGKVKKVIYDLGEHLAILHSIEGSGYGIINQEAMLKRQELMGSHKSWYDFLYERMEQTLKEAKKVFDREKSLGKFTSKISSDKREILMFCFEKSRDVFDILKNSKKMLDSAPSRFLNGNIHLGSIAIKDGGFMGLTDFKQTLLGDPVDDLAYFSIMPKGDELFPCLLKGWLTKMDEPDLKEKIHLYRLFESYRKIFKRYYKYKYLDDYPEPLYIAQGELGYYNIK